MKGKSTAADKRDALRGGETTERPNDTGEPSGLSMSRRQVLKGAGLVLGASGALAALGAPTPALADDDGLHFAGTWLETVSQQGLPDFQTLYTYDSAGGMIGTGSIDSSSGFKASPVQGAWAHDGAHTFKWHAFAFSFDDAGNLNGIYEIKEKVTLNHAGTAYSGAGSVLIKPAGTNPITMPLTPFTVSAVRIGV